MTQIKYSVDSNKESIVICNFFPYKVFEGAQNINHIIKLFIVERNN